jgi:undecaprenyl phosphate-alpha-L-ara4N flippase subunit ArnE
VRPEIFKEESTVTIAQILLTGLTVLAMAVGQVLFKLAAGSMLGGDSLLTQLLYNKYLWLAMVVYFSATVLWVALLRHIPLHLAYPFVAFAFFFVPVLGHWFLNEPMRWQSLLGAVVIALGVWISVGLE